MSSYTLRPLNPDSEREMNTVIIFSMMTLWESRPELRIDPASIPDFGFQSTLRMYQAGTGNPAQRYLVALDGDANIVGHSIIGLRTGEDDERYGYFWSRYVLPAHRRKGIASRFMDEALTWFKEKGATRAEVHTHLSNQGLRKVFERKGFRPIDRRTGRWEYVVMSKKL
jgi:GNAT superfamily N-acetyltransferase